MTIALSLMSHDGAHIIFARLFLRRGVLAAALVEGHAPSLRPASAHLELGLISWGSMSMFGLFYGRMPAAAMGWAARVRIACTIVAVALFAHPLGCSWPGRAVLKPSSRRWRWSAWG